MPGKILIVDDDVNICQLLNLYLVKDDFTTSICHNGRDAIKLLEDHQFDIVLLDIMMPEMDGFETLTAIRKFSNIPVILVSAKGEPMDKISGLNIGADDYVTKPFSMRELLARVKANLRRREALDEEGTGDIISVGDVTIDLKKYIISRREDIIPLTTREFELITFLASQKGQVFTREALLEKVWGYEYFGDARTVDVTIRRLRSKLEDTPETPRYVLTKRGVGYYFSEE